MCRASLAPPSLLSRDLKWLAHNVQLADGLAAMARLALSLVRAACFVVCLPFDDALAGVVGASRSCGSCTHPSGHVSHSHMPWPNCSCATTGLLVSLRGAALVVGLIFFLPITDWNLGDVPVVAADGYLSCFPIFHIAWCASMPMLWFLCLRPTLVLVAVFVSGIGLVARPFQWPLFSMEFVTSHVDWSMEQPFSVALATAEGAPLVCYFRFGHPWCVSPLYAGCFLCLHPASRLLDGYERGIALAARPHWWQCFGVAFAACFTAWLPLERLGFSARPHDRLPTCSTSYLHWAKFSNYCFGLCRLPTSSRISLPSPYLLPLWRRLLHYLPSFFREVNSSPSFVTFFYYILIRADSLLAKLGDLTFTAEEQDAIVVAPDSVAIPAEDFASSLVGKVASPPTIDGGRLIRQFRSIWKDDKVLNILEINPNFFLISFASSANRANVLKRGPWDFQKYWFALEQADPNRTIHDYSFLHMCIWVRIHNIPLSLMMAALARVLGASIGKVIMTDTRLEDGNMGEFMWVRVLIDTSKPLRRCVVLSRPDAKASMCPLQYERLPLFCHGCGLIGHSVLACPTTPKVEG
ncbi:hypothetical protein GQ457_05G022540 [Hibiscus cannabinus]